MSNKIEAQVIEIVSSVFEIPKETISWDSSPDTIRGWDSIKHMGLIFAIEEEFDLELTEEEIVDMLNIELVIKIIEDKISAR